uniref:Inorganic phosphate cotransporter n=1 Tax=Ditylenchus dipsaci TaxID=166011 RepID=A0A915D4Q8_9BILA
MAQRKLHSSCGNLTRKASKINGDLNISKSEQDLYLRRITSEECGVYWSSYKCPRNICYPFVARVLGSFVLVAVRFLMGCGQGILVPCMNVLIAHWFPMSEKSTAIAIATTGNQISVIVAMLLTAELCQFTWLGGWLSPFTLTVLWASSQKSEGKELKFIQNGEHKFVGKINPNEVPWSKILGSFVVCLLPCALLPKVL